MEIFLNQLAVGLTRGAEYALVAAGLTLIFGVVQIVNFAHGELYMVGAYCLFFISARLGLPYGPAAAMTVLAMALVGAVVYWVVIDRIIGKGWQTQLVATLAGSILLVNLVTVVVGSLPQVVHSPLTDVILSLGGVQFSAQRLLVLVCAVIAFAALYLFLTYTKVGKAMRAMSQNREACVVVGIPVRRMGLVTVVVGSALAGVAAVTIPPLSNLQPTMGVILTIKAFAAVVMGGFGNVSGAIVSAFVLGIVEALGIGFISSEYGDAIVFGIMILVLLIRPHGLFGRVVRV